MKHLGETWLLKNSKAASIIVLFCILSLTVIHSDTPTAKGDSPQTNLIENPDSIQDSESTTVQTNSTQQNTQSQIRDNFDDNTFSSTMWDKIEVNGGVTAEKDEQLQVTGPDSDKSWEDWYWSQAGYVTKYPVNVNSSSGFETSVNVVQLGHVSEMVLLISDQKVTDRDPVNATNWYMLNKVLHTKYYHINLTRVVSRIDGNVSWNVETPWLSPSGQLKIKILNGTISFFENGLFRYSEPYAINASECYVYIYTSKWGHYSGTDCFDDFSIYPGYTYNRCPTSLSISARAESLSTIAGSTVNVLGKLANSTNGPLQNKTVVLSYAFLGINSWIPISSAQTDIEGNYNIQWINSASGTFTLKTEWSGDADNTAISNTTTLSFLPSERNTFVIESNSTVYGLTFDNATATLSFNVTGPTGTTGYVKATIAKNILLNGDQLQAYMDGKTLNYTITSAGDSWIYCFNYHHSTHQISLHIVESAMTEQPVGNEVVLAAIVTVLGCLLGIIAYVALRRGSDGSDS
jgi:hypothetical protein